MKKKLYLFLCAEKLMKIREGMTSGECFENKWFYMKYIGKYLSA